MPWRRKFYHLMGKKDHSTATTNDSNPLLSDLTKQIKKISTIAQQKSEQVKKSQKSWKRKQSNLLVRYVSRHLVSSVMRINASQQLVLRLHEKQRHLIWTFDSRFLQGIDFFMMATYFIAVPLRRRPSRRPCFVPPGHWSPTKPFKHRPSLIVFTQLWLECFISSELVIKMRAFLYDHHIDC